MFHYVLYSHPSEPACEQQFQEEQKCHMNSTQLDYFLFPVYHRARMTLTWQVSSIYFYSKTDTGEESTFAQGSKDLHLYKIHIKTVRHAHHDSL